MRLARGREAVAEALRRLAAGGLVRGAAGNVSVRDATTGFVAISPAGLPYERLTAADVALVDADGAPLDGAPPSSELPMHLAILRARPEVGAVVHTHSPYATALGCVLDELPVVAAEQAVFVGGPVPVAPYAPTGDEAMGEAVLAAAGSRLAAIVRNHGPVCLGADLERALACAFAVEECAQILWLARLQGEPSLLPADEVARLAPLALL